MTLIQPSSSLDWLMSHQTVSVAAPLLVGGVAVTELSVKLPTLTAALLEEDGR